MQKSRGSTKLAISLAAAAVVIGCIAYALVDSFRVVKSVSLKQASVEGAEAHLTLIHAMTNAYSKTFPSSVLAGRSDDPGAQRNIQAAVPTVEEFSELFVQRFNKRQSSGFVWFFDGVDTISPGESRRHDGPIEQFQNAATNALEVSPAKSYFEFRGEGQSLELLMAVPYCVGQESHYCVPDLLTDTAHDRAGVGQSRFVAIRMKLGNEVLGSH